MNKDLYSLGGDSSLTIKDQPHRQMSATGSDYGLPLLNETDGSVSYSEKPLSEDNVQIFQVNVEQLEPILA